MTGNEPYEYRLPKLRLFPEVWCPVIRQWPSKYETEREAATDDEE